MITIVNGTAAPVEEPVTKPAPAPDKAPAPPAPIPTQPRPGPLQRPSPEDWPETVPLPWVPCG